MARTSNRGRQGAGGSGARECGDPVEPGQLVRVGDGVDAGDPTVLDGKAHRRVELTASVDADGGGPVDPDGRRLEVHGAQTSDEEARHPLGALDRTTSRRYQAAAVGEDDDVGGEH